MARTIWTALMCSAFILLVGKIHCLQDGKHFQKSDSLNTVFKAEQDFVKNVHVVFMNHLDVGYNGIYGKVGFINNVLNKYFTEYFPRAMSVASQLRTGGYQERFIYTTHPWLVALYLDCPQNFFLAGVQLKCPNSSQIAAFKKAIAVGDIDWHAGPMNMQPENMEEWLFEFGISISKRLDKMMGIQRKYPVLSQRDVPGMTQTVIPILARNGVVGVSVGVNPTTSPPAVPNPFVWKYGTDEVLATWHPGGYPDNPGPDPAHPGGASRQDCTVVAGFSDALCFAFRTDNSGPPQNIAEVMGYFDIFRAEFPSANIRASTFSNYMGALYTIKDRLPVVTNEISDTWIQGIASDPRKSAEYRAVSRVLGNCLKQGKCSLSDQRVVNAGFLLTKLPEHTWGLPTVGDKVNWTNQDFYKAQSGPNYKNCALAWLEQRNLTYLAVAALGNHPVVTDIKSEVEQVKPRSPHLNDYVQMMISPSTLFTCTPGIQIGFGLDGSISSLIYQQKNIALADFPLGKFMYYTYNETDFDNFGKLYNYGGGSAGFFKLNSTVNAHPDSNSWGTALRDILYRRSNKCDMMLRLELIDSKTWIYYGAPREIWINYVIRQDTPKPGVDITFQWFDKTSTRLPEALMFTFAPVPQPSHRWFYSKIGNLVDPYNVIQNGSQYQHGIDEGVYYINSSGSGLRISSLDAPLVCPFNLKQPPSPFAAPLQPITENITGMAFNLYNNIWDTNYILWYPYSRGDEDYRARFSVEFINNEPLLQQKLKNVL